MMIRNLSELIPSQRGIVRKVGGKRILRQRMMDMGLVYGAEIIFIRSAPLGDPIEFSVRGYRLSWRKEDARNILVELTGAIPLCMAPAKEEVEIAHVHGGFHFKQRVEKMGLDVGTKITVQRSIRGGPVVIDVDRKLVQLGHGMARKILVNLNHSTSIDNQD
jgi:ferrous iron transport protein A